MWGRTQARGQSGHHHDKERDVSKIKRDFLWRKMAAPTRRPALSRGNTCSTCPPP